MRFFAIRGDTWRCVAMSGATWRHVAIGRDVAPEATETVARTVGIRAFQVARAARRVTKNRLTKKGANLRTRAARGQWVSSPGLAPRACVGCSPLASRAAPDGGCCAAAADPDLRGSICATAMIRRCAGVRVWLWACGDLGSDALCAGPRLWLKTAIRRYVAIRGDTWRCVAMSRAVCPLRV